MLSIKEWRASPTAVLPLAFLQALGLGLVELPVIYLFREIRCDAYRSIAPPHTPEVDICRSTAVQKAYSSDVALFLFIVTSLTIIVSGPYGRLSDLKGRKIAMGITAALNLIGDVCLYLSVIFPTLRTPIALYFSAVVTGLGGGFSANLAAQSAFIAESSSPIKRSFCLGLALVMFWLANATAPLVSAALLDDGRYSDNFTIAIFTWVLYLLYLVVILREKRPYASGSSESSASNQATDGAPDSQNSSTAAPKLGTSPRELLRSFIDPLILIFRDSTLRWLSIVAFAMLVALGAFGVLIVYCDRVFGMLPSEAGVLASIMSILRAVAVVVILPIFLSIFHRLFNTAAATPSTVPDEREPLLGSSNENANNSHDENSSGGNKKDISIAAVTQELVIVRVCFVIDALGMLLLSASRSPLDIILSSAVGSLGAPAGPSLQALVTLASPPNELGRILAGFSVVESAAVAVRSPVLFSLYSLTLEILPQAVWLVATTLFLFCGLVMMNLRPARFTPAHHAVSHN